MAVFAEQADRLVGIAFGLVAGAHDDDALGRMAHAVRLMMRYAAILKHRARCRAGKYDAVGIDHSDPGDRAFCRADCMLSKRASQSPA
jgi:hypothetical protein